jgi:Uma2 family endonuclease
MALAPAPPQSSARATPGIEPLHLPWDLRLTPEQFEQVCQANPDAVLELAADGTLIARTSTGGETGAQSLRLDQRLLTWAVVQAPGTGSPSTVPRAFSWLMGP